jgi:signal transduction histidine kinase/CheY-like chemotaxis protein
MPLAARLSPAASAAHPVALAMIFAGLLFSVPVLIGFRLHRDLFERVLAERFAVARAAMQAAERQSVLDARLREAERQSSLGRMASGIAHEFNNILTAIGGAAELLRVSRRLDPAERELTQDLTAAVDRAARLVRQLWDYTGRGRRKLETFRVCARLQPVERFLRAGLSKQTSLELRALDDAQLRADPLQIDQLIIQLVQNAERSYGGKPGDVIVELDRVDCGVPAVMIPPEPLPAGAYAVLRVVDRGCGIEPAYRQRIFEPFFSRFEGGRGLGLAAVLGIVRGHGGGLAVHSAPGSGTAISVFLPCHPADESASVALREPEPPSAAPLAGLSLLVVDDEPVVRTVLAEHLVSAGARVHTAGDGAEALGLVAHLPSLDAAFVDVSMPRLGGLGFLEGVRSTGRQLPVVLMTGHAETDVAGLGAEANVAVLLKPFRLDEIGVALARARSFRRPAGEPGEAQTASSSTSVAPSGTRSPA